MLIAMPSYMLDALGVKCGQLVDLELIDIGQEGAPVACVTLRALKRRQLSLGVGVSVEPTAMECGGSDKTPPKDGDEATATRQDAGGEKVGE